jgi:hypothetical protein
MSNAFEILAGRPRGKRPLGRSKRIWEDDITVDIRETGWEIVE